MTVDANALPLLRRMITHGCFWRSNGWPEEGAWQLDLYALPRFNKPAWTADWKPQHFLALLDDYERLLRKEQDEIARTAATQEAEVASCSLRRPVVRSHCASSEA
jgi:hypothetical protein